MLEPELFKAVTGLTVKDFNLLVSLVLREIAILGLFMALAYLVLMVRVLMNTYELGLLRALAVIGLLIAAPYLLMPPLIAIVRAGNSRLSWATSA